jgi:hypothetical protein
MGSVEWIYSVGLGIGLAAACGFRVFLPFLALGVAARLGSVPLAPGFAWLSDTPALAALATATALEIAAYYVPWLDHALDVIASPVAVLAGVLATAAVLTDMPPLTRWGLAVVAGGGVTGVTQAASVLLRLKAGALTGGLANPFVATAEWIGAAALSLIAIAVPLAAIGVVAAALALVWHRRGRGAARAG